MKGEGIQINSYTNGGGLVGLVLPFPWKKKYGHKNQPVFKQNMCSHIVGFNFECLFRGFNKGLTLGE